MDSKGSLARKGTHLKYGLSIIEIYTLVLVLFRKELG